MPQRKLEYEDYLKFVSEALELAKKIPRYFSKFSNHIYCNQQKLTIYILMQKLKLTTRGIVSFLRSNLALCMHFGLFRIPVHTTIVRFVSKIEKKIDLVLDIRQALSVAVDSTGFELETKSYYYRTTWNSDKKQKAKRYSKLSICIDTDTQLILTYRIRRKLRHDTKDFKYLLKDLKIKQVLADRGYDDKKLRKYVFTKLNAIPIIPYRKYTGVRSLRRGRRKPHIDEQKYHQRSKVETVFSVIKRKYGSVLRNKSYATQRVELISKLITYNLDRRLNYLLLILRVAPEPYLGILYLFASIPYSLINLCRLDLSVKPKITEASLTLPRVLINAASM